MAHRSVVPLPDAGAQAGSLRPSFSQVDEMNELTARRIVSELEDGSTYQAVELLIDGESLIERVGRHEAPLAQKEGHPGLAGAYAWPALDDELSAALRSGAEDDAGKVAVLECTCGLPGCWPLLVKITAAPSEVIWSEFEQPHRNENSGGAHWRYEGFGPFVFAKNEYQSALRAIV